MTTRPIPPELAPGDQPFDLDTLDHAFDLDRQFGHEVTPDEDDRVAPIRRWQVTDDGAAEWAMRMLAAIQAETDAMLLQYALWLEPITRWRDEQLARLNPRRAFFDGHLREYGIRQRALDPKRATISLPSGKVATRAAKAPTVEVTDEEAVLKWASESLPGPEYDAIVKVTTKLLVSEIRKQVVVDEIPPPPEWEGNLPEDYEPEHRVIWKASGEVVPGLDASLSDTTATVTPTL